MYMSIHNWQLDRRSSFELCLVVPLRRKNCWIRFCRLGEKDFLLNIPACLIDVYVIGFINKNWTLILCQVTLASNYCMSWSSPIAHTQLFVKGIKYPDNVSWFLFWKHNHENDVDHIVLHNLTKKRIRTFI